MDIVVWSLIGIILFFMEIFFLQGMGIIFAGMAAICVSMTIYSDPDNMLDQIGYQIIYFLFYTSLFASCLWIPMKKFFGYAAEDEYKHVIGTIGIASKGFKRDEIGYMSWSGIQVKCKLSSDSAYEFIEQKSHLRIIDVIDNIYIVYPVREDNEDKTTTA